MEIKICTWKQTSSDTTINFIALLYFNSFLTMLGFLYSVSKYMVFVIRENIQVDESLWQAKLVVR